MSVVTRKVLASQANGQRARRARLLDPWKNLVDLNEDLLCESSGKKERKREKEKDAPCQVFELFNRIVRESERKKDTRP